MLLIILTIVFLLLDQLSKYIIINYLNRDIIIIKNFFYLIYTKNNGAAFSIFTGKRLLLIVITTLIIGFLIHYVIKNKINNKLEVISFSLVIGGSLGNLIDRVVRGYVIDFVSIKIFGYSFPIFNVADTFICIGIFLLLIVHLRKEKNHDNR